MNKARWIWYRGDFEIYHSLLVHSRREDFGIDYPCFWSQSSPFPRVNFWKGFTSDAESKIKVISNAMGAVLIDNKRYPIGKEISVSAGAHSISVQLIKISGLPCIYINSKYLITDNSWTVNNCTANSIEVGDSPCYYDESITPENFIFSYKRVDYIAKQSVDSGMLFDFGKEIFGPIIIEGVSIDNTISLYYGESKEEALEIEHTTIRETVFGKSEYRFVSRAFRYIFAISTVKEPLKLYAEYEYLPLDDIGSFSCECESVKNIWDICSYTFHLNSREFFLDGIKRDRWVWSGDAYQAFLVNNYLFFDSEISKRTIIALLGKPPYEQHINTITDYSMYLIIGTYEYYYATGDDNFIKFIFVRITALYDFLVSRLDERGFVCEREGDWIFIDWSEMDKSGAICAEQILLWRTMLCMYELSKVCGIDNNKYIYDADNLKKNIFKYYWNEQKGAFIDCFASNKNNVTRHANIFAILYDLVDEKTSEIIVENVFKNEDVLPITTPYFKFFELMAMCKIGNVEYAQNSINSYWGSMISLGTTTVWEQYNQEEKGVEHYAMYGAKFGKSLCHAWGSGPIFILGRYCLGVYPVDIGYKHFIVQPKLGIYKKIEGTVPVKDGKVSVKYADGVLRVLATRNGGILKIGEIEMDLKANVETIISCKID